MGEELLCKINNNNYKIVNELIELITDENINSTSKLKQYQDELFMIDGKKLNQDEQIEYCIKNIQINGTIPETMDFTDVQKVIKLKEKLNTKKEEKEISVIILYSLLGKDMMLPYDAYNYIINNKL
ncbi:MAG: hypothetical protein IKJ43_00170 [Bacilli bacterium]|nr:hypothetical protein [Bacilli bacterium]